MDEQAQEHVSHTEVEVLPVDDSVKEAAKAELQRRLIKVYARIADYSSEAFDFNVIYALHKQATTMLKALR